jgi:HlyD family secretion protein
MTANVSILIQRAGQVLRLPNSALRFRPAASLVAGAPGVKPQGPNWAIVYTPAAGAKLQPVAVKLGITDGNFTEIKEGTLTEGQQVAVGMSARASNPASPAPPAIPRRI